MLHPVMTRSPRLDATATNKPLGDDLAKDPSLLHRLAWKRRSRRQENQTIHLAAEAALRERHA